MSWHTIMIFGCGYLVGVIDMLSHRKEATGGKR
jgi:hypothetical protein